MPAAFSRTLVELYQHAEHARPDELPAEVLRLLRRWIGFDGAVLGMGASTLDPITQLRITHAHVEGRDAAILDDYGRVSDQDPVTGTFMRGLANPLAVDCGEAYRAPHLAALRHFAHHYGLRHLMLFGDHPTRQHTGRWLVLYRSQDRGFGLQDADYLHAAWLHVSRAMGMSRSAMLDRCDPRRRRRASALVGGGGRIEAADPHFLALLQREWPEFQPSVVPAPLLAALQRGVAFRGQRIEVDAERQGDYFVCVAVERAALSGLTPSEAAVAHRFAAGMSAKEIARALGVAPNTVRSQITRLYAKLQVHDKAALAQRIMAASDGD